MDKLLDININQIFIFGLISVISIIIVIYLIQEESDILDIPLIPIFLTIFTFGILGVFLSFAKFDLIFILIISSAISGIMFIVSYFLLKNIITRPEGIEKLINKTAIVEIPIEKNKTGRIKVLKDDIYESYPAKANLNIPKDSNVKIIKFIGSYAFVEPIYPEIHKNTNLTTNNFDNTNDNFIICKNCKASVDFGCNICPYCGCDLNYD